MKKIKLILLLLTFIVTINAQSRYNSGYIITNNNDTIQGLVAEQRLRNNHKRCLFKVDSESKAQTINPGDILEYYYENKKYVSKTININSSEDTVFLNQIIDGKVNFYVLFNDKGEQNFFVENIKDGLIELNFRRKPDEKGYGYYETDEYKGKLNYLMKDCPGMQNQIQSLGLRFKSIKKVIVDYNECQNADYTDYSKKSYQDKNRIFFGLQSSVIVSQLKGYGNDDFMKHLKEFQPTTSIGFGGIVSFPLMPVLSDKWFITIEPSFYKSNFIADSKFSEPHSIYVEKHYTTFNINYVETPIYAEFQTLNLKKSILFYRLGFSPNLILKTKDLHKLHYTINDNIISEINDYKYDFSRIQYEIFSGLGIYIKFQNERMLKLAYDFSWATSFGKPPSYSGHSLNYYIRVAYVFSKTSNSSIISNLKLF